MAARPAGVGRPRAELFRSITEREHHITNFNALAVATEIARHLPGEWTATEKTQWGRPGALLHGPEHQVLSMVAGHHEGKWTIRGEFEGCGGQVSSQVTINAALSKTPTRLAGDITRRVLPEYGPLLAVARQRQLEQDVEHARRTDLLTRLITRLGGVANRHYDHRGHWGGTLRRARR